MLASDIFDRARRIIQDETSVRWPLGELRLWLNDAMREIALQKPNASSRTMVLTLRAGTYQTIPSNCLAVLRVVRNLKTADVNTRVGGRSITAVQRDVLDAQLPDWHDPEATPQSDVVKHVVYDTADPASYYVFPGNTGTGHVEAIVSVVPTPVDAASPDPEAMGGYAVTLPLPDIYASAVLDYVLYRAYSKDAMYAGNAQRAVAYYQRFANSIGIKFQAEATLNPNTGAPAGSVAQGANAHA